MRPPFLLLAVLWVGCDKPGSGDCPAIVIVPAGELRLAAGADGELSVLDVESAEPIRADWTSDDEGVAIAGGDLVTGVAAGRTTVTAESACGARASAPVHVAERLEIDPPTLGIEIGEVVRLRALGNGAELTAVVDWSSSDDGVATLDEPGVVRGVRQGRATLRAAWQGLAAEVDVDVRLPELPDGSISWRLAAWAPSHEDLDFESVPEITLGDCGQGIETHLFFSGFTDAPVPGGDRGGHVEVRVSMVEPERRGFVPHRQFMIFEETEDGRLWLEEGRYVFRSGGHLQVGATLEVVVAPDDPDFLPSSPLRFELIDERMFSGDCCEPEACFSEP